MLNRDATAALRRLARGFPVVALTGPRQSGKTTLVRATFPGKPYVSLEDPDERGFALEDPRAFLARFARGAILDEVQRAPELFSYLQTRVDERRTAGQFVLTGSQQFGLMASITQSLAGRVGIMHLLPFALAEMKAQGMLGSTLSRVIFRGQYPALISRRVTPPQWYASYVATYIERDVRQLAAISDLAAFRRFLKMCAARCGQLINLSSLANDCGISHVTARAWLTVLEASYIVHLLPPYHVNFGKRLVKTPKLYFYDTGLASYLLDIREARQLETHPARGALFESLLVSEWLKHRFNQALPGNAFFWRDNVGNEIDLLLDHGRSLQPVEMKSGQTPSGDYFAAMHRWLAWAGPRARRPTVVYGGSRSMVRNGVQLLPWNEWPEG
ncbi:MAG: AAA family ATPase [Betaproteobacteria bacterium RIFCSPLOWO2_02_FULL_62_17]|nr:MAG: AAA family ATPase [Betaproteobacteria bacterium RIFCSPLOWO2_02_FULL_62_17]